MISRRDLLVGMVRRLREGEEEKPVSGIGADIGAADSAFAGKDFAGARDLYKGVLKGDRSHKEARIRLGLCHYHLGEYVQAKDALLMIHKQHPAEYLACLYLGLAYARRGQLDKCMDVWRKFVDRDHVAVMREINVQRALFETGEPLAGPDVADAVEEALRRA
jgi:tetratricopeptide (TPR) repeat protein